MGLLADAIADVRAILTDTDGFGLATTVTSPSGTSAALTGFASDIGQTVDAETGQPVTGRRIHVAYPVGDVRTAFSALPEGFTDTSAPPWLVELQLPTMASAVTYAVMETMPDDHAGCVVCFLEPYGS